MAHSLRLFIDGDALPNLLKPILFRAINRLSLETFVISNKKITIGESSYITYKIVELGADEADNHIVEMCEEGDLTVTADIPLADRIISKNTYAIDHRGKLYTKDNIKQYLAMRNLMDEIRSSGEITKGPPPFSQKDAQTFANQFDKFLTKYSK